MHLGLSPSTYRGMAREWPWSLIKWLRKDGNIISVTPLHFNVCYLCCRFAALGISLVTTCFDSPAQPSALRGMVK